MIGRPLNSFLISALFSLACSTAAHANEQLRVPFACEVTPRGVVAYPSREQSYRIIGGRDAAPFTACAYNNPNRCRTMMLHRFDIDCQGQRINWPEFYAAISERRTGRRARFAGGHLVLRVRPELRPERRRSRFDSPRFTAPRYGRPFDVEMPDGYAPIRGTLARFDGQRASPRRSIQATRDPFSVPRLDAAQRRFAERERTPTPHPPALRSQPGRTAELKKPKAQPKPATQQKQATQAKPVRPTPAKQVAIKTAPKTSPSTDSKKATNAAREQNAPSSTEVKTSEVDKSTSAAKVAKQTDLKNAAQPIPSVVPTLLNGSKAEQKNIADLLQERAAHIKKDLVAKNTAPKEAAHPVNVGQSKHKNDTPPPEPAAPSLTNTLAVLGIVASLLLGISFAARRGRTPKPSPQQSPAQQPLSRHRTASRPTASPTIDLSPAPAPNASSKAATITAAPTTDTPQQKNNASITLEVPVDRAPDARFSSKSAKSLPATPSHLLLPGKEVPNEKSAGAEQNSKADPQLPMPKPNVIATKPNPSGPRASDLNVKELTKNDAPAKDISERA